MSPNSRFVSLLVPSKGSEPVATKLKETTKGTDMKKRTFSLLLAAFLVAAASFALVAGDEGAVAEEYEALLDDVRSMGQSANRASSQQQVVEILAGMEKKLVDFRGAHKGSPEAIDAGFQLGSLKVSVGGLTQEPKHYAEGVRYLAEYVQTAPADTPRANVAAAHYYLAEAYKGAGKFDDAIREYQVVVTQFGDVNARMTQFARTNLQDIEITRKLAVGAEPIDFDVQSLTGDRLSPAQYKGKVLLIDFWATWCKPCLAEMPHVKTVYDKYKDKGFEIVGISLDRSRSDLDRYIESNRIAWPQYFDGKYWQNEIATVYGVKSIPATYLIDRKGKIRYKSLRGKQLEDAVDKLISESM